MAIIPDLITAGVTLRIEVSLAEYPAPDWSLDLRMVGIAALDVSSEAMGTGHVLAADPVTTAAWESGRYAYQLRATDGTDVVQIERGELVIAQDLDQAAAGFDGRSHARRVLDAIEAVIEDRATKDQQSYTINNRSLSRTPLADLLKLRAKYRAEVQAETASGAGYGRMVKVRFG